MQGIQYKKCSLKVQQYSIPCKGSYSDIHHLSLQFLLQRFNDTMVTFIRQDSSDVIDREDKLFQRRVKEALHIRRTNNFNKDQGLAVSTIWNGLDLYLCAFVFCLCNCQARCLILCYIFTQTLIFILVHYKYKLVSFFVVFLSDEGDHSVIETLQ